MKDRLINLFENSEKLKEHRWTIHLVILGIILFKDFIKKIIGSSIYNIIIICTMILIWLSLIYGCIGYIKQHEEYDIKKDRFSIIYFSIMTSIILSYMTYIFII